MLNSLTLLMGLALVLLLSPRPARAGAANGQLQCSAKVDKYLEIILSGEIPGDKAEFALTNTWRAGKNQVQAWKDTDSTIVVFNDLSQQVLTFEVRSSAEHPTLRLMAIPKSVKRKTGAHGAEKATFKAKVELPDPVNPKSWESILRIEMTCKYSYSI